MNYKAYITNITDPYTNLATEEYLFDYADENTNILYLWQNDHTIVIGRNQHAQAECKVDDFLASGGTLARRRSGGGAVYHDLGNLNFSIIGLKHNIKQTLYLDLLFALFKNLGLTPEYSGRNDILINGLKCSGNAFFDDGNIICQHGTILINTDFSKMSRFLTPDREKMERHAIQSVASRVINLSSILPDITVDILIDRWLHLTDAECLSVHFSENLTKLRQKYASDQWIYGGAS